MSSMGHLLTMISIVFFFFGLFDSFYSQRISKPAFYGVPRTSKRVLYYLYKINVLRHNNKTLFRTKTFDVEYDYYV